MPNPEPASPLPTSPAALSGIRVLDLSRVLAAPYCSQLLADYGADVIKVEQPGTGDGTRQWGPPWMADQSAYFVAVNRNKRSITLNLKAEEGREVVRRLAQTADIVLENFLPGTLDEMGLGYAALSALNPRLIYCAVTGYGQTGPWRDRPGYDFVIQAQGGLMSITGPEDGPPSKAGVAIRTRLQHLGLFRESGHEHFRGSVTFPIHAGDGTNRIVDIPHPAEGHGGACRGSGPAR